MNKAYSEIINALHDRATERDREYAYQYIEPVVLRVRFIDYHNTMQHTRQWCNDNRIPFSCAGPIFDKCDVYEQVFKHCTLKFYFETKTDALKFKLANC